jgi:hypothetical protein
MNVEKMGMSKHIKCGNVTNSKHFSGKTGGKPVRRKGSGLTHKQRQQKHGQHKSKYSKE